MRRILFLICIASLVVGCSSRLAYKNLDWIAQWYLDGYIELNDSQEAALQVQLDDILKWHREEELEQYRQQLIRLKDEVLDDPLTIKQWADHLSELKNHWTMIRFQASLKLVDLAKDIDSEQVDELFENLKEKNTKDREEYTALTPDERQEKLIENVEDAVLDRIGSLTEEQKEMVLLFVQSRYETRLEYISYAGQLQERARQTFSLQGQTEFQETLLNVLSEPEQFQSLNYKQKVEHNRVQLVKLLVSINGAMNAEQTEFFVNQLEDWINTIGDLQGKER